MSTAIDISVHSNVKHDETAGYTREIPVVVKDELVF
jgi:hypothetical protein